MTEKRFTIGDRTLQEVYECCIPAILDGGIPCTQSQVLKLLNELHEENENLKDVNVQCCNDYSAMRRDVLQYKEENEQLKKEILWWKYRCGEDISGDVE